MTVSQRIGITLLAWVVYSFILMGILTSKKQQEKLKQKKTNDGWTKRDGEVVFRNARILCFVLAISTGLLI